jgi:hypothetical protein
VENLRFVRSATRGGQFSACVAVKDHNKLSAGAAMGAGVRNFEAYNGAGLSGLYGGMNSSRMKSNVVCACSDRFR